VTLSRQYAKFCDIADFDDPTLLEAIRSILPERDPLLFIERKVWEMAMLTLFLGDVGRLDGTAEILSVGAGNERILYWLTNHAARVVATDIYGDGPFAGEEAAHEMLTDPGAFAPAYPVQLDRLEPLWMDACALDFPDESFDVVYTLSSIEHFGSHQNIARAAAEIGRVLRPGGHAVIVTDGLLRLHPTDTALADSIVRAATLGKFRQAATPWRRAHLSETLTRREIERHIVRASGLEMMQPLDVTVTDATWQGVRTLGPHGIVGDPFPQVLLRYKRSVFGSVFLALAKP
jgi:SAM-dependent methyltransferase